MHSIKSLKAKLTPRSRKDFKIVQNSATSAPGSQYSGQSTNPESHLHDDLVSPTSQEKVLHIPELLELILLHLPERRLFVQQRVCSQWRTLITTSKSIRQKLFLEQESCDIRSKLWALDYTCSVSPYEDTNHRNPTPPAPLHFTPVLSDHYITAEQILSTQQIDPWHCPYDMVPAKLGPIFDRVSDDTTANRIWPHRGEQICFIQNIPLRSHALWTEMFLTVPSCQMALVTFHWIHEGFAWGAPFGTWSGTVRNPDGLRVKDLLHAVLFSSSLRSRTWSLLDPLPEVEGAERLPVDLLLKSFSGEEEWADAVPVLVAEKCRIELVRMVVPTEEEWRTIK